MTGSEVESDVLVVHCSDARYQPHFQEFLRGRLGLARYALVAVPGGPQFLTLEDYLPKFSWVGWRWVKFLGDQITPRRVILIAHHDCRWYLDPRFAARHAQIGEQQRLDLRDVRRHLAERLGPLEVEAWYARLDGDSVAFERLV